MLLNIFKKKSPKKTEAAKTVSASAPTPKKESRPQYSLSRIDETPKQYGNYNIYGNDVSLNDLAFKPEEDNKKGS